MTKFKDWWQSTPKSQKPIWTVLCYTLILAAGIDIGRTLYHLIHAAP